MQTGPPRAVLKRIPRADDLAGMSWPVLLVLVLLALGVLPNLRIVPEGERLVVFRMGRFHRVLGPGLHLVPWGIESARRVDPKSMLADWQGLSEQQLAGRLEHLARTGQLIPTS